MRDHLAEGLAAHRAGRLREARASYERALKANSADPNVFHLLGVIDLAEGVLDSGERRIRRALQLHPAFPDARYNLARLQHRRGELAAAAESYGAALALNPRLPEAEFYRGAALRELGRLAEAAAALERAAILEPGRAATHDLLGQIRLAQGDLAAAEAQFRAAVAAAPADAMAWMRLGTVLQRLRRLAEAAACFRAAVAADPALADALYSLAAVYDEMQQPQAAIAALARLMELAPGHGDGEARRRLMHLRLHACDWSAHDAACADLLRDALDGAAVAPFHLRAAGAGPAEMLAAARTEAARHAAAPVARPPRPPGERLRIGYLSSDLYSHPVGILAVELFERHDRARFEVFAYSHSRPDPSTLRQRLEAAFDRFVDIRAESDAAAAARIAADGIDVLVDLNGYSGAARPGILAARPAPVQANMLGYLGPMALPGIDCVIADPFVVPAAMQPFYPERILHLPHCYLPLDTRGRSIAAPRSRRAYGLPETGFVFANFSAAYKIAPAVFAVWMRLLERVPGSVLWLYEMNPEARANLAAAAAAAGIAPGRLVFAPKLPQPEYLARFAVADLFLDTLPCSACTTGIDSLWAGLPVLTCAGGIFAGRHAGSALRAAGLPELVTHGMDEYEALAVRLATEEGLLAGLRARLARREGPLFDMASYARALEAIFEGLAGQGK